MYALPVNLTMGGVWFSIITSSLNLGEFFAFSVTKHGFPSSSNLPQA